ncbi:MAG: DUF5906 domain-containing protein [Methylomonas sp.]|jgi:hypothetical protein|uniref:primase-helicase family protein n=1 Tax=Methylomonas sp. TaxID=418 RepID=UPI0025EB1571|nr:primase-helicase family protein [Methylomonas sp.]MCK9608163.1 DUF5906 domain-containing protein [Methylomonas sp.]
MAEKKKIRGPTVFEYFRRDIAETLLRGKINAQAKYFLKLYLNASEHASDAPPSGSDAIQAPHAIHRVSVNHFRAAFGRLYPSIGDFDTKKVLRWSGATMPCEIRNHLFSELYYDLDIVNAHPTIALALFEKYELPHAETEHYVNCREDCLNNVISLCGGMQVVNRDEVKILFISLLYGGSVQYWAMTHNIEPSVLINSRYGKLFDEVKNNIRVITAHEDFADIRRFVDNARACKFKNHFDYMKKLVGHDEKPTIFAFICQNIERMALEIIIKQAADGGFEVGALIFDGCHIRRTRELTDAHLRSWESAIARELNIPVKLLIKPMNLDPSLLDPSEGIDSYEQVKASFEKAAFFCRSTALFYEIIITPDEYMFIARSYNDFALVYKPLVYIDFDDHHNLKKFCFTDKWIKDPNQRQYLRVTFAPPPLVAKQYEFNQWMGFCIEQYPLPPENDCIAREGCELIIRHMRLLTNNDETLFHYMWLWFADMVKFPGRKSRVLLILRSKAQQIGKSLLFEIFENLFGKLLAISVDDPNLILGEFNANIGGKLLICLEELKKTAISSDNQERLKNLLTRREDVVNEKNKPTYRLPSLARYLVCTNSRNSLPVEMGDARICAIDVKCERQPDAYYFALVTAAKDKSVLRRFFEMLKNEQEVTATLNLATFRPKTEFFCDMRELNVSPDIRFFCDFICEQNARTPENEKFLITHRDLHAHYLEQITGRLTGIVSPIQLGKDIKSMINDVPEDKCGIRSYMSGGCRK